MSSHGSAPLLADNLQSSGIVIAETENDVADAVGRKVMGIASVELLGRLENDWAQACRLPKAEKIDDSAATTRTMLEGLKEFCDDHLVGRGADQVSQEIEAAKTFSEAFDKVLKTRPLGNALMRTFWKADETDSIRESHHQLGQALIRATGATLYHAIMVIGFDSDLGKEIDQSTVLLVDELSRSW